MLEEAADAALGPGSTAVREGQLVGRGHCPKHRAPPSGLPVAACGTGRWGRLPPSAWCRAPTDNHHLGSASQTQNQLRSRELEPGTVGAN